MKQYRIILASTLAFLVLVSSSSFMVGIHLCGGQIQKIALFTKADGCEMEKIVPPCHNHETKRCCDDETIIHKGENFKGSVIDITISPVPALAIKLPPVLISEVIPSAPGSRSRLHGYDPPFRAADPTVLLQVFLI